MNTNFSNTVRRMIISTNRQLDYNVPSAPGKRTVHQHHLGTHFSVRKTKTAASLPYRPLSIMRFVETGETRPLPIELAGGKKVTWTVAEHKTLEVKLKLPPVKREPSSADIDWMVTSKTAARHTNKVVPTVSPATKFVAFDLDAGLDANVVTTDHKLRAVASKIRVIAGQYSVIIRLPINDLDTTNSACLEEVKARLRQSYKQFGEYLDDNGRPTGQKYEAGRQGLARKLELAHELMFMDNPVIHVWAGMDAAVAEAIESAILHWHNAPKVPVSTGRPAAKGFDRPEYSDAGMVEIIPVLVERRFLAPQGHVTVSGELKAALLDEERRLLYFSDYISSADKVLEERYEYYVDGVEEPKQSEQFVDAYRIVRELPINVRNDGLLEYSPSIIDHLEIPCPLDDLLLFQATRETAEGISLEELSDLRYCVENWRDIQIEAANANASPTRRQVSHSRQMATIPLSNGETAEMAIRYLNDGRPSDATKPDGPTTRCYDALHMSEMVATFDDAFETGRFADMIEQQRLDAMVMPDKDGFAEWVRFDDNSVEDEIVGDFAELVKETADMELHTGKVSPVLHYNAHRPDEWHVTPKNATVKLAKLSVKEGCRRFHARELRNRLDHEARPFGHVVTVTPYERQAHDNNCLTIYVGQTWAIQEGSPLANGPVANAKEYRTWISEAIKKNTPARRAIVEIATKLEQGQSVRLSAWPLAPKGVDKRNLPAPEYAEVIGRAALYVAKQMRK